MFEEGWKKLYTSKDLWLKTYFLLEDYLRPGEILYFVYRLG